LDGDDPIGNWVADMQETWAEVHWDLERIFEGHGVVVTSTEGSAPVARAASR
jgi:hypothetical protein